jgi:hypothetical protein
MTVPMADISQLINTNIALGEDKIKELGDERLKGDKLRKDLTMQKVMYRVETLKNPKTVCCHVACTEYRNDGNEGKEKITVYK